MTPRENLCAALDGEEPEWIPYTINEEFVTDDPAWVPLFSAGLGEIRHVSTVREETTDVEWAEESISWQGRPTRRIILRTPLGEIQQVDALGEQLVERCCLTASGPGRYISLLENYTTETWAPRGLPNSINPSMRKSSRYSRR